MLELRLSESKKILQQNNLEIKQMESKLQSVESKWINNEMAHDTYNRDGTVN